MMDVQTAVYNRSLDTFAACTRPAEHKNRAPAYNAAESSPRIGPRGVL
jgi:lipid A ethanolaminephosphotransferase